MGWLIDKFREWFCKHDWELVAQGKVYASPIMKDLDMPEYRKWVYICKKCKRKKEILG